MGLEGAGRQCGSGRSVKRRGMVKKRPRERGINWPDTI